MLNKDKYPSISDSDSYFIIGETFNLKPEFYMEKLYKKVRENIQMLYGAEKIKEMEKYIIKKFYLSPGEQILLEFDGRIYLYQNPKLKTRGASVVGTLYVTNNRIITQGKIRAFQGEFSSGYPSRKRIVNQSHQDNCYGYIFPTKNIFNLKKLYRSKGIEYRVEYYGGIHKYKAIVVIPKSYGSVEIIDKLFEILRKDAVEEIPSRVTTEDDFMKFNKK